MNKISDFGWLCIAMMVFFVSMAFVGSGKLETQRLQVSGDSVQAFDANMAYIHRDDLYDLNHDGKVDLTDMSVLAYWVGRGSFPAYADLNKDGVVDQKDLEMMKARLEQ